MQWIAKELEEVAAAMSREGSELVEQSRAYSYLGIVYSDLASVLGKKMLLQEGNNSTIRILKSEIEIFFFAFIPKKISLTIFQKYCRL